MKKGKENREKKGAGGGHTSTTAVWTTALAVAASVVVCHPSPVIPSPVVPSPVIPSSVVPSPCRPGPPRRRAPGVRRRTPRRAGPAATASRRERDRALAQCRVGPSHRRRRRPLSVAVVVVVVVRVTVRHRGRCGRRRSVNVGQSANVGGVVVSCGGDGWRGRYLPSGPSTALSIAPPRHPSSIPGLPRVGPASPPPSSLVRRHGLGPRWARHAYGEWGQFSGVRKPPRHSLLLLNRAHRKLIFVDP
jgi:hypothetical protein